MSADTGIIDDYCESCIYLNRTYYLAKHCDFMAATGTRRGCPPGEGCTRRELGGKRKNMFGRAVVARQGKRR